VITAVAIVAHQGGWDEVLLVAGPIVVIVGLLALAKRRVDRAADAAGHPAPDQPGQD
jgi:hypothetical protein